MQYRIEAWTLPGVGLFARKLSDIPVVSVDVSDPEDDFGYGAIEVPASYLWLSHIIEINPGNHTVDDGALIVGYAEDADEDDPAFEFIAAYADRKISDRGDSTIRIHGPGIMDRLNEAIVAPYSDDFPDWIWGGRELLTNPNFEDGSGATVYTLWHDGTGGTFTLDVTAAGTPTEETAAIAWDDGSTEIQAAVLATGATAVTVTGAGTEDDPFEISIQAPVGDATIAVNDNSLTGTTEGITLTKQAAGGLTSFEPWHRATNPDDGGIHGSYPSDGFRLTTDAEAGDVIEGTRSLRINGLTQFVGAQQEVNGVKPNTPLYAGVSVKTGDPLNRFRLILRDLNEELLATTPETSVPDDFSVNRITLANVILSSTSTGVVWRFSHTRDSNPEPFFIDLCSLREGLPATTIGDQLAQLFDAAKARGRYAWIERTWTATEDSNAVTWDDDDLELAYRRGMRMGHHAFEKAREQGYELHIARKPGTGAGDTITHQLHLYNPAGRGTDKSAASHPQIVHGHVIDGEAPKRHPRFTRLLVEGPNGRVYVEDTDMSDRFGVIEDYLPLEDAINDAALTRAGEKALADEKANLVGYRAVLTDENIAGQLEIGDTINWLLPEHAGQHARRISSKRHRLRVRDGEAVWQVEIGASRVRDPDTARKVALRRLLTEYKGLRRGAEGAVVQGEGVGRAGASGAYMHLQRATAQSIAAGDATAISWDAQAAIPPAGGFAFTPGSDITIPRAGYYDIGITLEYEDDVAAPTVYVTRPVAGDDYQIWPPDTSWSLAGRGKTFSGDAPGIPLEVGDTIAVWVSHGEAGAQNLARATLGIRLVDRIVDSAASDDPYRDLVLSHGPILYWRLSENSGDDDAFVDQTGNGHHGTYRTHAPGTTNFGVSPLIQTDAAIEFVSGIHGVSVDDDPDFDVAALTVEAWIQTSSATDQTIAARDTADGLWQWQIRSTGVMRFVWDEGADSVSGVADVADGAIHHIAVTHDGSTVRLYVDGVLDNSQAGIALATGFTEFAVGYWRNGLGAEVDPIRGTVDEVAFYGRALSATELAQHNSVGRGG